jgi:probable selenium-dependent hydroxylase accessory protein YqeC
MKLSEVLGLNTKKSIISIAGGGGKTSTLFALAEGLKESRVLLTTTTKILKPDNSDLYDIVIENNSNHFLNFLNKGKHKNHIVCGSSSDDYPGKLVGCSLSFIEEVKNYFDYIIIESDGSAGRPIKAPAEHEPVISEYTDIYIGVIGLDCLGKNGSDSYVHRPELFTAIRGKDNQKLIDEEDIVKLINSPVGLFKEGPQSFRPIVLLNKADKISLSEGKSLVNKIFEKSAFPLEVILNSYLQPESVLYYRR